MGKQPNLSASERLKIQVLHEEGYSQVQIASRLQRSRNAIQITLKRFAETRSHISRQKSGRPRVTSTREDKMIVRKSLSNRRLTSKDLAGEFSLDRNKSISFSTVSRRLNAAGLKGCKARKKPWLKEINRKRRLEWAKKFANWTAADWDNVIWSDESNIEVYFKHTLKLHYLVKTS